MKNLLTLLLLFISLLAFGQSNNQSVEVEIKYWKSIAESNDTVAYREYLQRYGENGLYKDEAITRITLLKTLEKQVESNSAECLFYSVSNRVKDVITIVRFDNNQDVIWLKQNEYDSVRSNLSMSRDYYENLDVTDKEQHYYNYELSEWKKRYAGWNTNEKCEYSPMKSTSARDVYFNRDKLYQINHFKDAFDPVSEIPPDYTFYVFSSDERNDEYYRDHTYEDIKKSDAIFEIEIQKTMQGYRYVAFSKDKSSFIMWFEQDNNLDGVIREKREYKRVPKEELLPKAVNYDFLNE